MKNGISSKDLSADQKRYKWKVLFTITLGTGMCSLDFSMVNLAFPKLTQVFQAGIDIVVWVTLAYTLANTSLLLIVGKIGDVLGRKRLYIVGEIIFTGGLIACAFSQGIGQLICFRIVLGVGASMILSCGPAFIAEAFPPQDLGKGMGILNASISAGFIVGPVVGGLLLNWLDWRSLFYTRIPFGLLATIMSILLLKPDRVLPKKINLDWIGTLISIVGLFLLVYGVNQISRFGLTSPVVFLFTGLGLILLILFVWYEQRVADPLLDFSLFKNGLFSCFSASLFVYFMAVPIFVLILPFFLIEGLGLTASQAGFLLATASVVSVAVGPLSGLLSDHYGEVWFAALGVGLTMIAYNLIRTFDVTTKVIMLAPILGLLGTGAGLFQTPNNSAILKTVAANRIGSVSAFIATIRGVGLAFGMALIGTVYAAKKAAYMVGVDGQRLKAPNAPQQSVLHASQETMLVALGLFAVVLLFTVAPKLFVKPQARR